ncbi:hypothetical protein CROQUDRAFT_226898 [Cronartium quercuum f. sp. fusiforme G11]|uniref:Uncharacterized protein n=1 Tax=Cronartium quercuum f. sp. fusiforme G11 TaxID=708437 RepID=A0A9P6NEH8_9BASI|nr:hypothetical protein CROQUDRAFT_226898 [Cronartium quercuum f. sp. fusiforme G11]
MMSIEHNCGIITCRVTMSSLTPSPKTDTQMSASGSGWTCIRVGARKCQREKMRRNSKITLRLKRKM